MTPNGLHTVNFIIASIFALLSYLFPSNYSYILGYISFLGFSPLQFFTLLFIDRQNAEKDGRIPPSNWIFFDYLAVSLAISLFMKPEYSVFCVSVECIFLFYILQKWCPHEILGTLMPILCLLLLFGVFSIIPLAIFVVCMEFDFSDRLDLFDFFQFRAIGLYPNHVITAFSLFVFLTFPAGLSLFYSFYGESAILILVIFVICIYIFLSIAYFYCDEELCPDYVHWFILSNWVKYEPFILPSFFVSGFLTGRQITNSSFSKQN